MIPKLPSMTEIAWYRTEMRTEVLLNKIKSDASLLEIVKRKKEVTQKLNDDIENRIYGSVNNFVTILIVGKQGTKKSSVLQSLAELFDPNFEAGRVVFSYDDFEKKFEVSKPKQWFIMDELVFQFGSGSNRIVQSFQVIIETQRKHGASIGVATPEAKLIPESLFTYVFETFDDALLATCPYNKQLHEPRLCKCDSERCSVIKEAYARVLVKESEVYIGFYVIKINWNNKNWQDYSVSKDIFNESVRKQQHNKTDYRGMAEEILKDPDAKMYKTKKALKILLQMKKSNLTVQESEMVVEHMTMLRKIEEANNMGESDE